MICLFVPPYVLRRLAAGAPGSRFLGAESQTLQVDEQLRGRRESDRDRRPLRSSRLAGRRVIHDAAHTDILPGEVARDDNAAPVGDPAVDEASESSGQIWDLFSEQFGRRSVDGAGTTVSITVHYGRHYDNAFWDGTQLVFGDGDGEIFERFTKPMDVMAHEFTHGVTQYSAGLRYQGQPGALNESVSDVFAALAKQYVGAQTADQADWLIGEGLFLPSVHARALRSMHEPGTAYDDPRLGRDPQVGSMADYLDTADDNGGVHVNSGIPNRAFALAAIGIGGFSWERAGRIWYDALTGGRVNAQTDFAGFAEATVEAATRLFPAEPVVAGSVSAAWSEVGVLGGPADRPATPGRQSAQTVAVRRHGGFAGTVRSGELDLDVDPQGPEVRRLLTRVELQQVTVSPPIPDRFVYTVRYGAWEVTVPEQDLTPELHRVVQLVLDGGGLELS